MTSSSRRWFTWLAVAVVLASWPTSAEAQTIAQSFEELIGVVKAEETVIVTDMKGRRVKGALTAFDEDSLTLATDGLTQTFARSEVSTIRVADGLGNGALIGAASGLGAPLDILAILGSQDGYVFGESGSPFTAIGCWCPSGSPG